jgi:hypothetical protein
MSVPDRARYLWARTLAVAGRSAYLRGRTRAVTDRASHLWDSGVTGSAGSLEDCRAAITDRVGHSRGGTSRVRWGVFALVCALAACVSGTATRAPAPGTASTAAPAAAPLDASYDWHGLVVMPFGTLLKESPIALHEVLLFHDQAQPTTELGKDCFTVDGAPPRLVGRPTEEYLLCFSHDRLDRIEASVNLSADEATPVFARACGLWLKNSVPPTGGDTCEGRDGGVVFSGHLGRLPNEGARIALILSVAESTVGTVEHVPAAMTSSVEHPPTATPGSVEHTPAAMPGTAEHAPTAAPGTVEHTSVAAPAAPEAAFPAAALEP